MGFFGGKKPAAPIPEAPLLTAKDLGVIIHVMPKDFLGAEASLKVVEQPRPSEAIAQVGNPPIAQTPAITQPSRRRLPLWALITGSIVILLAIGAIVYVFILKSKPQPVVVTPPVVAQLPKAPEPVKEPPKVPEAPKVPTLSKDTDSDGLTDIEERMYGTDYRNPDSDGDTFLDGNEVYHRYDPNGLSPSTLLDTGAVKTFQDAGIAFTITYPANWKPSSDIVKNIVTFKTPTLAQIVITGGKKDKMLSLEDWILKNVQDVDITSLESSYSKEGYYVLRSKDGLVAYVDAGDMAIALTYDLNGSQEISYIQTFAMMVNSLKYLP